MPGTKQLELTLLADAGPHDPNFARRQVGDVHGQARAVIVTGVDADIVVFSQLGRNITVNSLFDGLHAGFRVQMLQVMPGCIDLVLANVLWGIQNLPRQVGALHPVEITERELTNTGTHKVLRCRTSKPACTDQGHPGLGDSALALATDACERMVSGIA